MNLNRPSSQQTVGERIFIFIVGLLGDRIIVLGFDYVLYPYVIWKCGVLKGSVVMTFLSFLICYATILFYDWSKQDWLGVESLKAIKEEGGGREGRLAKTMSWLMRKGEWMTFIALSIWKDPFITVAYMRKGAHQYNGLSKRDWNIFLWSVVLSNAWWTLVAFGGVSVVKLLWQQL